MLLKSCQVVCFFSALYLVLTHCHHGYCSDIYIANIFTVNPTLNMLTAVSPTLISLLQ